ncbi:NanQ anomerase/TabA/YiaL family protein [Lacticaseibacillus sp. GG6-2]
MIISNLNSLDTALLRKQPVFNEVFQYIETNDLKQLSEGRYDVGENGAFILIQKYQTRDEQDCKYESHRKYIDFQLILSGQELMRVKEIGEMVLSEDHFAESDAGFYELPTTEVIEKTFNTGEYAVFFPGDVHQPCVKTDGKSSNVIKACIKIPVTRIEAY